MKVMKFIIKFIILRIRGLLMELIRFALPSLDLSTISLLSRGGWGKSRLKTNSAQLKLKLGLSLATMYMGNDPVYSILECR